MMVSYNKLWKLLIDKKMKKKDLLNLAEISTSTLAKLGKDQQVSMDVITRICNALNCNVGDIMDILPDSNQ
ncbi:MAG: helix-turn-helix transcriptional regulator [Firmicutes bacterium]|nr:helix-turn-helix transcriptional regulator [Bacillota bacterium]